MTSAAQVRSLWQFGGYIPPRRIYATDGRRLYVVIEDRQPYLQLYDEFGTLFRVPRNKCRVLNEATYECSVPSSIYYPSDIPLTPESYSERANFARHQILPIVYYGGDIGY